MSENDAGGGPADTDRLTDALAEVLPLLLNAMEALGVIARFLHPPQMGPLIEKFGNEDADLIAAWPKLEALTWPEHLADFRERIETAVNETLSAFRELRVAPDDPQGIMIAYRALRHSPRAQEALFALSPALPPISRFFLERDHRLDQPLATALAEGAARPKVGVMHADNEPRTRGGFSIYVPETTDFETPMPLVMAMHGGSGHGRGFLWTWIREARTRGAILVSPTSTGDTWSLMGEDTDSAHIEGILDFVRKEWPVDESRMVLTGMSDGGTFTYVSGLQASSPFTHLAPISAAFHPMLVEFMEGERLKDLPIYLVHGAQDWMFPIEMAHGAHEALKRAGTDVTFREIEDLSHTYPREANAEILDWAGILGRDQAKIT